MEEMSIESTLVEAIKNGDKTIEIRLGKPRFLRIQEEDIISIREDFWHEGKVLESLSGALRVKITQVLYFETLQEALQAIDFQAAIPSAESVEDAVAEYRKYYSPQEEAEFGVVAFSFALEA